MTQATGDSVQSCDPTFFPSRWRALVTAAGVVGLIFALFGTGYWAWTAISGLWESRYWLSIASTALAFVACLNALRRGRRLGVTVGEEGVLLVGSLNGGGSWRWDEIAAVDVVEEEYVRNAPHQVLLRTRDGDQARLGPITGREAMVDAIRARLRPQ